jgi:porphobilinogen synthase
MSLVQRPRRLRLSQNIRNLAAETVIAKETLIMPYFVSEDITSREKISSMPGISRVSIDVLLQDVALDFKLGIKNIILFGIPQRKDEKASGAYAKDGIIQRAVRILKKDIPDVCVITDVCLCEYMSHGHCGIVENNSIHNDKSLELLAKTAVSHAEAGADIIAPSDMMDGRVAAIRSALDNAGFEYLPILSYAAKYASSFYGPFRDAAGSAPQFGDRKTYQMDYRNVREAEKEVLLDIEEGADMVMVKPALSYLDVISRVRSLTRLPLCAYNVSGEYAMVKAAAQHGYVDEEKLVKEILTSIYRAGAQMIISYHTRDIFQKKWF